MKMGEKVYEKKKRDRKQFDPSDTKKNIYNAVDPYYTACRGAWWCRFFNKRSL